MGWTIVRFSAPKEAGTRCEPLRIPRHRQDRHARDPRRHRAFAAAQLSDDRFHNAAPAISN